MNAPRPTPPAHLGIAEQGKLHALRGEYEVALLHYREAMRQAVRRNDPEVFFRHYLECAIEALEQSGSWPEVLDYCDRALAHYRDHPPPDDMARRDLASIHQRRGVVLLKSGKRDAAREALRAALAALPTGQTLPLTSQLLRWLDSGYHLDPDRITAEQRRWSYFSVRTGQVDARIATPLPPGHPGLSPRT
ncbi:hypothetical protein JRI60_46080 [Archangium violaceum]|uniref:hypothetical protein n=1 Tax=Archangium violaceum TaxID=83451 RepID=UPI00194ED318|nr:hypothetical protein [Archangium violaceum]QRN96310.1 hypothetical protein JRI60_46080 [Archangium violaceum]